MLEFLNLTIPKLLLTVSITWLLYWLLTFIYRLTLHPLSHFPGPILAGLTFWYETYYDVYPHHGPYTFKIAELHRRYGPIIRINPVHLHISDPSFYNEIYAGKGRKGDKDVWAQATRREPGPMSRSVVATIEHERHRMRRAPLDKFFSKKSVRELDGVINAKLNTFCDRVAEARKNDEVANLSIAFSALTMDIISEYCFGKSLGCLDQESWGSELRDMLNGGTTTVVWFKHFPWLLVAIETIPMWMMERLNPKLSAFQHYIKTVQESVDRVIRVHGTAMDDTSRKTIFHDILDSKLPVEERTPRRLLDEGIVLIGAGSETTARTLAGVSYYLLSDRTILAKLVEELRLDLPGVDTPLDSAALEQLPYLTACVNEALRLVNPAPSRFPRIAPNEDLQFGKWKIPRGTAIMESAFLIHLDPSIFPDPYKFVPERWLDDPTLTQHLHPFTKGSRACLGLNLAMSELYMGIAKLFRRFEFEIVDTPKDREVDVKHIIGIGFPSTDAKGIKVKVSGETTNRYNHV